jgi:transcription initiation factor IIE alpha subunit
MARKIRFEKMFNEAECSELIFCGPSDKDSTYAMCVGCPACGEDIQVVLSAEEIEELHGALGRAKLVVEKLNSTQQTHAG